jgi:hypothetical protein
MMRASLCRHGVRGSIWRARKYETKSIASFQAGTRQVRYTPNLLTYRCGAANRRFGPESDIALFHYSFGPNVLIDNDHNQA